MDGRNLRNIGRPESNACGNGYIKWPVRHEMTPTRADTNNHLETPATNLTSHSKPTQLASLKKMLYKTIFSVLMAAVVGVNAAVAAPNDAPELLSRRMFARITLRTLFI